MALKADTKNDLTYLDKLLKDNGLEIILPDLNKGKKEEKKNDKDKKKDKK